MRIVFTGPHHVLKELEAQLSERNIPHSPIRDTGLNRCTLTVDNVGTIETYALSGLSLYTENAPPLHLTAHDTHALCMSITWE